MPYITVGKENSANIDLYYQDLGAGKPVVLVHGWPLSGKSWEKQITALVNGGYRVITYDRRGFGQSSQPAEGYDYDTLTDDLKTVMGRLELNDSTLVGFSMGGGEVARYLGTYGNAGIRQAVFISAVPPFLLKTEDNPEGVDAKVFQGIAQALAADRPAFLAEFLKNFYNVDKLGGKKISDEVVQLGWSIASTASPIGTLDTVASWQTDFRADVAKIHVPTLVIHGDSDRIVPLEASGQRTAKLIPNSRLHVVKGGPHGLNWTHAEEVNKELLDFLGQEKSLAAAHQ